MAFEQTQVKKAQDLIHRVVAADFDSATMAEVTKELKYSLDKTKEGRSALPEILGALENKNARRALKLIAKRAGQYTGVERILISGVVGSLLSLLVAVVSLSLAPRSAQFAATLLCEDYEKNTTATESSTDEPAKRLDPMSCPTNWERKGNNVAPVQMSRSAVVGVLFIIFWMPSALLSYALVFLLIRRK